MHNYIVVLLSLILSINVSAQNISTNNETHLINFVEPINIIIPRPEQNIGLNYFENAEVLENKKNYNDALYLYNRAAYEFESDSDIKNYANATMKMAQMHLLLDKYNEAEQIYLNVVLKNYSKLKSKAGQMNTYFKLGQLYQKSRKYTESMWFYTQQGIIAQQIKNNNAYIESILGIANVKINKKDYLLAKKDLVKVEDIIKNLNTSAYNKEIKNLKEFLNKKDFSGYIF